MKLYNFDPSPNPLKVRVALAEIGKNYDSNEVVLFKGEQRKPEFLEINPNGKVPVIIDGDLTICESNAILTYLGKEYGKALWPPNHQLWKRKLCSGYFLNHPKSHLASALFGSIHLECQN